MNRFLESILALPHVLRWHTRRTTRRQNLAEHSGLVALLAMYLAPADLSIADREALYRLALLHDLHETRYGDLPFPAKLALTEAGWDIDAHCQELFWGHDIWLGVSPRVKALVHVADVLEAAVFARHDAPGLATHVAQQARDAVGSVFPDTSFDRDWVTQKVNEVLA